MERSRPSSEARRTMWRKRARYSNATAARSIISENSAPAKSAKRSTICCTGPHCIANYEAILLGKVYGLDAQKVRETLLQCPATNGTLARWDGTKFTWQEKDMDIALDLAQKRKLPLPFFGQVDQMIKWFSSEDVAALLY